MSNEIRRLRRHADDLERQIAHLREEARQREAQMQRAYQARMDELQASMQRALDTNNEREVQKFQQQIQELSQNLSQQIQNNYDALEQRLTQDLLIRHRDLMREMEDYYQRMQQYIDQNITSALENSDAEKAGLAQKEYAAALEMFEVVSHRAHEELFPGRLDIHRRTLDQAQLMMSQNQMEASAATSVMLAVKLKDFEYQIREKITQWFKSYLRMSENYAVISKRVMREVLTIDGQRILRETAMHWLNPEYYVVFETLDRCENVVEGVGKYTGGRPVTDTDVENYILTGTAPTVRELEELYRMLKYQIPGLLGRMKTELATAYTCSAQRRDWAQKIAVYMKGKHNTGDALYDGFGQEGQTEDEKNLYCIRFRQTVADESVRHYTFYIVPVVKNGVTENHVRLHMDFLQGNMDFQRKYEYKFIRNLMKTIGVKQLPVGIGTTPDVLEGSVDEEYMLRPDPSGHGEILSHYKNNKTHKKTRGGKKL